MTAKRFIIEKKGGIFYIFDNGNLIPVSDGQPICDLLNSLNDENEKLKQNCKNYEWYKQYKNLLNENEQLKNELFETSKELLWATSDEVDRVLYYEDEVEELRKEIFE